jgi:hypothetical protein
MATTLLISGDDISKNTILGGNIDKSKYQSDIKTAQNLFIKPLLGGVLYDKICTEYENMITGTANGLTGSYYTMYEDYIKEMTIHSSVEIYLGHGAYSVGNSGISKLVAQQGSTSVSKEEVDFLIQNSRKLYNHYKENFIDWIKDQDIPEWTNTISCTATTRKNNIGGWIL